MPEALRSALRRAASATKCVRCVGKGTASSRHLTACCKPASSKRSSAFNDTPHVARCRQARDCHRRPTQSCKTRNTLQRRRSPLESKSRGRGAAASYSMTQPCASGKRGQQPAAHRVASSRAIWRRVQMLDSTSRIPHTSPNECAINAQGRRGCFRAPAPKLFTCACSLRQNACHFHIRAHRPAGPQNTVGEPLRCAPRCELGQGANSRLGSAAGCCSRRQPVCLLLLSRRKSFSHATLFWSRPASIR